MPHHEAIVAATTGGMIPWWLWILGAAAANAKAGWRAVRAWIVRRVWRVPPAPHVAGVLTIKELIRIQPTIDEYVTELSKQGAPWTTLAGLIRELNAQALSASALRGAVHDTRFYLDEAACLLREPIDFNSNFDRQKIRSARTIIHTAFNHLTTGEPIT